MAVFREVDEVGCLDIWKADDSLVGCNLTAAASRGKVSPKVGDKSGDKILVYQNFPYFRPPSSFCLKNRHRCKLLISIDLILNVEQITENISRIVTVS